MENQNLEAEIQILIAQKEHSDTLLQQALSENEALRAKIQLLERYMSI